MTPLASVRKGRSRGRLARAAGLALALALACSGAGDGRAPAPDPGDATPEDPNPPPVTPPADPPTTPPALPADCTWSSGAPDDMPGPQGERRVPLSGPTTAVFPSSDATAIVYAAGGQVVQRRLVTGEERWANQAGDLRTGLGGDRVAVELPLTEGSRPLVVLDLGACTVTRTPFATRPGATPSSASWIDWVGWAGDRLFVRTSSKSTTAFAWTTSIDALDVTVPDARPTRVDGGFSLTAETALGGGVLAWFQWGDLRQDLVWRRVDGSAAGRVGAGSCEGLVAREDAVVWTARMSGLPPDDVCAIRWLDLATGETRLLDVPARNPRNPKLRGPLLVYEDDRHGDRDLFALDLATGAERPVFVGPGDQRLVGLLPGGVVWTTVADGELQVFWNPDVRPGP